MNAPVHHNPAVRTTCPYCGVGCGLLVRPDGKGAGVSGDPQHPANFGSLCSKGSALGETLSLAYPKGQRDELIDRWPDIFSVTPHFQNYDYVLVSLHAANETVMRERLEGAWRLKASKQAVADYDAAAKH